MADFNTEGGYVFKDAVSGSISDRQSVSYDTQRLERLRENWNFYLSEHWTFKREDGEPLITINYLAALIDKKIAFLIGQDFTLSVPAAFVTLTLPVLEKVWSDNGRQNLNYEIAQEGHITGDVFILVTVGPPTVEQLRFDPLRKYRILIQRLNSHECFPEWDALAPPTKYGRKMRSFTIVRWIQRKNAKGEYEDVKHVTTITDTTISTKVGDDAATSEENALGEIPVVHIKNKASSRTSFGIDDCHDLIPLNREINEKATDVSDTINYNAAPITVIIGARAKALERSPRAIWSGLPTGSSVQLLRLEGDLTSSVGYIERIRQAMHDLSGVPTQSFAPPANITGTSGEALVQQLTPLIDEKNKKRVTYEPGYERVNYFILRYSEMYQNLRLPMGLCEKCGGKIAITYVDDPFNAGERIEVRKCYMVNKDTFDFLDPEEMKVPFIREHSLGAEVTKIPLAQAEAEYGKMQTSYWDLAPEEPVLPPGEVTPEMEAEFGGVEPQQKLPPGFKYPPEPEKVQLEEVKVTYEGSVDEKGNPVSITVQEAREVFVIPMECNNHSYLSPLTSSVVFNDTMPKDKSAQANLLQLYLNMRVISRAYAMQQIGIENIDDMWEQIQSEGRLDMNTESQQQQMELANESQAEGTDDFGAADEEPEMANA